MLQIDEQHATYVAYCHSNEHKFTFHLTLEIHRDCHLTYVNDLKLFSVRQEKTNIEPLQISDVNYTVKKHLQCKNVTWKDNYRNSQQPYPPFNMTLTIWPRLKSVLKLNLGFRGLPFQFSYVHVDQTFRISNLFLQDSGLSKNILKSS